jgi:DNA-binding NarL/FixJ family response regulator
MPVRLVLVDDHPLFREGLRAMLSTQADFHVVGETSGPPQAYRIIDDAKPDVLVLDIVLQRVSGITVIRQVKRKHPHQRILVLSMLDDEDHVARALAAGATGYATKNLPAEELFSAIRKVARGEPYFAAGAPARTAAAITSERTTHEPVPSPLDRLTRREREIFELAVSGVSNLDIAAQLSISSRTVETHRGRIMRKLGVHSVSDLVRIAARLGLLDF